MWPQRGEDLFDSGAVFDCLLHLAFSACTPPLMTSGSSKLFDECSAFLRTEAERLIHGALPNEEKAVLCKARAIEQLIEITKADALSIQQVLLPATSVRATRNFNLREREIEETIVVGDAERYLCKSELTALL